MRPIVGVLVLLSCRGTGPVTARTGCTPTEPLRTCTVDTDCAAVLRNADCCGTLAATGVNVADRARYEEQERTCPTVQRNCRCMADDTIADDGSRVLAGVLTVQCLQGRCATSFAPAVQARSRAVADCSACGAVEVCVQVIGGQPPPPGQPANITTNCGPVPSACLPKPSCQCLATRSSMRGDCAPLPNGTLRVLTAAP